jgi:hypothetical protein
MNRRYYRRLHYLAREEVCQDLFKELSMVYRIR